MHLPPTVRLPSRPTSMVGSWVVIVGCNSAGTTDQPVTSESAAASPHSADSSSTAGYTEDQTNSATLLPNSDSSASSATSVSTPPSSSPGTSDNEPASIAVTGHIIDFWGHSVPDVSVAIDDAKTLTDADGKFTLRAVPP